MILGSPPSGRIQAEDRLRATLLSLVLRALGDDYLELVDGAAPSDQRLDCARWLTPDQESGKLDAEIDAMVHDLSRKLEALGLRGMLYIASDAHLIDERRHIRDRLYGGETDGAG